MASSQDTEITLGTGKMLVLFFGLVVVCGVFFGVGFSLGRSSVKASAVEMPAAPVNAVHTPAVKPASSNGTENLTFYKTVGQDADSTPPESSGSDNAKSDPAPAAPEPKPVAAEPTATPAGSGYYVQVAAVTKQEDAEALVEALKKKQYQASANNNAATDKLYHVQIGPFGDIKEAEAMRAKLVSDGYNPILKK